jgi:hypothetical protein
MGEPFSMGDGAKDRTRRVAGEALLLALGNAGARDLVGPDALRAVLDARWRELTRSGSLELAPLAELLAGQPGYRADPVDAALLRVKTWEGPLGIEVVLPAALAARPEAERARLLDACKVVPGEVARLLRGGDSGSGPRPPAQGDTPRPLGAAPRRPATHERAPAARPRISRPVALVAGLVGVLGLGFAAWHGLTGLREPAPTMRAVPLGFAGEIPLTRAERRGDEVVAVLSDEAWLSRPDARRRAELGAALARLPDGTRILAVKDPGGTLRATAQRSGGRVVVRLY